MTTAGFTREELQHAAPLAKASAVDDRINLALIQGDLSRLSPNEKRDYYLATCRSLGLNPLTKPFEYLKLNGREVFYANKGCAEQLRMIHNISITIPSRTTEDGVYVVTSHAAMPAGRCDESTGAVALDGLRGEAKANAMMKAETKSKRRVTLSICGLNMLDETEVADIPSAQRVPFDPETGEVREAGDGETEEQADEYTICGMALERAMSLDDLRETGNRVKAGLDSGRLHKSRAGNLRALAGRRKRLLTEQQPAPDPSLQVGDDPAGLL